MPERSFVRISRGGTEENQAILLSFNWSRALDTGIAAKDRQSSATGRFRFELRSDAQAQIAQQIPQTLAYASLIVTRVVFTQTAQGKLTAFHAIVHESN